MTDALRDSEPVGWKKVACYLLAVELTKDTSQTFPDALHRLRQLNRQDLERELSEYPGNRAATALLDSNRRWLIGTMTIGSLRIGAGTDHESMRWKIAGKYGGRPTIAEFASELDDLPEDGWDKSLTPFRFDSEKHREAASTLVVYQEEDKPGRWYLGDGYHRAVVQFRRGSTEVDVFVGLLK